MTMFEKTNRNFKNIEDAKLREKIDKNFNAIHDELSICYYNFWKQGKNKEFVSKNKTYDVQKTVEKSKKLFDKLHGEIFVERDKKLDKEK